MNGAAWVFLVIVIVFILFGLTPKQPSKQPDVSFVPPAAPPPVKAPVVTSNPEEELAVFYTPANAFVPEDFPRKPVGSCPYSRPQKEDLPLANVPMCLAVNSQDRLQKQA